MPRTYSITFENTAVTAAQDLVQVKGAAGKTARILRQWVSASNSTLATAQMLSVRGRFLPATVVDGTGGANATPRPFDPGDAAASIAGIVNSTNKASSNGTVTILEENGAHIYAGYDYFFPRPPIIGPSESYVFELLSTVSGNVNLSGGVVVEESGG